jgi:hypothetical protein
MERADAEKLRVRMLHGLPPKSRTPPVTEPERRAVEEALKEGGQMIAKFAERQVDRERIKQELAQQPENELTAALYREVMNDLGRADTALSHAALAYHDEAFFESAITVATRILKRLEELACK